MIEKWRDVEMFINHPGVAKLYRLPLPMAVMLQLKSVRQRLKPFVEVFVEQRKEIAEKYCDKAKDGTPVNGPRGEYQFLQVPGNQARFNKEYAEMLDADVRDLEYSKVRVAGRELTEAANKANLPITADDLESMCLVVEILEGEEKKGKKEA